MVSNGMNGSVLVYEIPSDFRLVEVTDTVQHEIVRLHYFVIQLYNNHIFIFENRTDNFPRHTIATNFVPRSTGQGKGAPGSAFCIRSRSSDRRYVESMVPEN